MAAEHKPNFILRILTELIWAAGLQEGQCMRLDETLSFFEEQIGTCERYIFHCTYTSNKLAGKPLTNELAAILDLIFQSKQMQLPIMHDTNTC